MISSITVEERIAATQQNQRLRPARGKVDWDTHCRSRVLGSPITVSGFQEDPNFQVPPKVLPTSAIHENSQVRALGRQEVGLIFGSARGSFSSRWFFPKSESVTSYALPPSRPRGAYCVGRKVGAYGGVSPPIESWPLLDQKRHEKRGGQAQSQQHKEPQGPAGVCDPNPNQGKIQNTKHRRWADEIWWYKTKAKTRNQNSSPPEQGAGGAS